MGGEKAEERRGRESVGAGEVPKGIKTQKAAICTLIDCKVGMREGAGLGVMHLVDGEPLTETENRRGGVSPGALLSVRCLGDITRDPLVRGRFSCRQRHPAELLHHVLSSVARCPPQS